jgi:RNA polymerase sigma-70 factor, ECF subfamily
MSEDDSDVRGLVANGDMKSALRLLMERYGRAVYRYCRELLRDAALAEDVHQNVFIQAQRDLFRFKGLSSFRTWLFAIAHNRALDAAKARDRKNSHLDGGDPTVVVDPSPPASDQIDDNRLFKALLDCLRTLRREIQSVLLMRFQQGFTFEEMGKMLGEKPGTLQAQVTRALPQLRTCIEARMGGLV